MACDIAAGAWKRYRDRKKDVEIREEIKQLAEASFSEARKAASAAIEQATPLATIQERLTLETYLSQIPATVRTSLKRPEDSTGRTVPSTFVIKTNDDVLRLLPSRPQRFRPGDPLPHLPEWKLVEPLGSGGFGEVWLARHNRVISLCGAVKFFHGQQAKDLQHESTLIGHVMKIGNHPNIVPLKDASFEGENPWLMYEYVAGGDLTDLIRQWQRVDNDKRFNQVVTALRQLSRAVAQFHRLIPSIVHRDLKPANILVDRVNKVLRISDFGIGALAAKAALGEEARGEVTTSGRLESYMRGSHTPLYSSPQQRMGADPDPRDDVHALGVIGFQMLTGKLDATLGTDFAKTLRRLAVPDSLIELLGDCAANDPDNRPQDAGKLLDALSSLTLSAATTPLSAIAPAALQSLSSKQDHQQSEPLTPSSSLENPTISQPATPAAAPIASQTPTIAKQIPTSSSKPRSAPRTAIPQEISEWEIELPGTWFARQTNDPDANWRKICKTPGRVPLTPGNVNCLKLAKSIRDAELVGLAGLVGLDTLDTLEFPIKKAITDNGLSHLPTLPNLRELNLSQTRVGDGTLARLTGSLGLVKLEVPRTLITNAGLAHLGGLLRLEFLDIGGTEVSDSGLAALSCLTRLALLSLEKTGVSDSGVEALSGLTNLRSLVLTACKGITGSGLASLTSLVNLDLSNSGATENGLLALGRLNELRRLNLAACESIKGSGLALICRATS